MINQRSFVRLAVLASAGGLFLVGDGLAALNWEPRIYPDDQIFPSLILSTARLSDPEAVLGEWSQPHLGDLVGLIGVELDDVAKGAEVEVKVRPNRFIEGGSIRTKIPRAEGRWTIHPKVNYNFDALAANAQPRPANVTIEVLVDGKSLGEKTTTIEVRSINYCLFGVAEDEETDSDYSYLFAAYVNENHPWVDEILRGALESGIVGEFDGYQSEDEDQVALQVFAIWNEMQSCGFHYSDITTTSFSSEIVYSQHVRLFEDSIRARQANCVDGTVLFAAILRKIGLAPYLVGVPGHMYLAVDLDEAGDAWIGVETTLIGVDVNGSEPSEWLSDEVREAGAEYESWDAFESAVAIASRDLEENSEKFDDVEDYRYWLVDIAAARELGIQPISSSVMAGQRE